MPTAAHFNYSVQFKGGGGRSEKRFYEVHSPEL